MMRFHLRRQKRQKWLAIRHISAVAVAFLAAASILTTLTPAAAHHSRQAYDRRTEKSITGTLTEFELINPHAWIHIVVATSGGATEDWSFEGGSVRRLNNAGWTPDMMIPGDTVTVEFNPRLDGAPGGIFRSVTLADGVTVPSEGRRRPTGRPGIAIRP